jgi:hypothetical protein
MLAVLLLLHACFRDRGTEFEADWFPLSLGLQQELSPLTSGRLSHSSGPLNGGGSLSDSPPVSPEIDDTKVSPPLLPCTILLLDTFLVVSLIFQ